MGTKVEISVDNIPSLESAIAFGASSIDLCTSLCLGGLTPSAGFVQKCLDLSPIPLHILIRPRAGNFVYSDEEIDIMVSDIKFMKLLGVHGVSFAALKANGELDELALQRLVKAAKGLDITFHRAFDLCITEDKLERVSKLGLNRITTGNYQVENNQLCQKLINKQLIMPAISLHQAELNETLNALDTAHVQLTPLTFELNQKHVRFNLDNACEQECESCQANLASYDLNNMIS